MNSTEYSFDPEDRPRFYGIYSAKVVDNADPLNKAQLRVVIPQITGTEVSPWASACAPVTHLASQIANVLTTSTSTTGAASAGTAHTHSIPALTVTPKSGQTLPIVPAIGSNVWVMFEAGDLSHPVWIGIQL